MSLGLSATQSFSVIGKLARMKFEPSSGKRQKQNSEVVVDHITNKEDQLPQVLRKSVTALKVIIGPILKKY